MDKGLASVYSFSFVFKKKIKRKLKQFVKILIRMFAAM